MTKNFMQKTSRTGIFPVKKGCLSARSVVSLLGIWKPLALAGIPAAVNGVQCPGKPETLKRTVLCKAKPKARPA